MDLEGILLNSEEALHFTNFLRSEHINLSMTLNIHVILSHYQYYFEKSGKTFRHTNGEFPEGVHSTLRRHEETHNFKVVKKIGTPNHVRKTKDSLVMYNSKKVGGIDLSLIHI